MNGFKTQGTISGRLKDYCNMDAVTTSRFFSGGPYNIPRLPQPMQRIVDYLMSKHDMGLINLYTYRSGAVHGRYIFNFRRISPKIWKKVLEPEIRKIADVRRMHWVRQRGKALPTSLRMYVDEGWGHVDNR